MLSGNISAEKTDQRSFWRTTPQEEAMQMIGYQNHGYVRLTRPRAPHDATDHTRTRTAGGGLPYRPRRVVAIGKLRRRGFSLRRIRQINEYCQLALNTGHPLVTETFKINGRDVLVKAGNGFLLDVLHERGTQAWDEVLDPFLDTLD